MLSLTATVAVFCFSLQVQAHLSCSSIFTPKISTEALERKLRNLAELKVQVDTVKLNPLLLPEALFTKVISDYTESYRIILSSSGLSEKAFISKLRKHVSKVQNKNSEEKDSETKAREQEKIEQRELHQDVRLKSVAKKPLGDNWKPDFYTFGTLSADGILFYIDRTQPEKPYLKSFNTKTLKHELFFNDPVVLADTVADGTQVAVLDRTWTLRVFDIATKGLVREVTLNTKGMIRRSDFEDFKGIDFSPSGERVVLSGNDIAVFDMNTGAVLGKTNGTDGNATQHTEFVRFTNENEIVFPAVRSLFKFNLISQQRIQVPLMQTTALQGFDVSFDGMLLTLKTVSRLITLHSDTLEVAHSIDLFGQTAEFRRVPGYSSYIFMNPTGKNAPRIYNQADFSEVFDFGRAYDTEAFDFETRSTHFTHDARKMVIILNEDGVYTMHTWAQ